MTQDELRELENQMCKAWKLHKEKHLDELREHINIYGVGFMDEGKKLDNGIIVYSSGKRYMPPDIYKEYQQAVKERERLSLLDIRQKTNDDTQLEQMSQEISILEWDNERRQEKELLFTQAEITRKARIDNFKNRPKTEEPTPQEPSHEIVRQSVIEMANEKGFTIKPRNLFLFFYEYLKQEKKGNKQIRTFARNTADILAILMDRQFMANKGKKTQEWFCIENWRWEEQGYVPKYIRKHIKLLLELGIITKAVLPHPKRPWTTIAHYKIIIDAMPLLVDDAKSRNSRNWTKDFPLEIAEIKRNDWKRR